MLILYGGTFDPVHNGHLAVARAARDAFGAEVRLLPAGDPPHRAPPGAAAADRADLVSLAIADEPGLVLDLRELERAGPSYTVDTLAEFRAERGPQASLAWLLGADAFLGLPGWHRWEELFDLAHWVIAVRPDQVPGFGEAGADGLPRALAAAAAGRWAADPAMLASAPAGRLFLLRLPPQPASASAVRRLVMDNGHWAEHVPPVVATAIRNRGLYGVR